MRILVVEDDSLLAENVVEVLADAGYAVDHAGSVREAEMLAPQEPYEAVVLDLGLPDGSGRDMLKRWRGGGFQQPVLVLTVRGDWQDKVDALHIGADDYLTKPFHPQELVARVQAIVRRAHGVDSSRLEVNGYLLDENRRTVWIPDNHEVSLTSTEFRLLRVLMQNRDRVLSHSFLLEQLYPITDTPGSNLIQSYIKMLRAKLGKRAIRTLRGEGYVFPSS